VTPQGGVAHWTNWSLLELSKDEWSALHMNIALVFVIVAALHLYLNWPVFWNYVKSRAVPGLNLKREATIALAVTLLIAAGSYLRVPPFSTVVSWNEGIKRFWVETSLHPPYPHAEDSTLEEFAKRLGVRLDNLERTLRQEGFHVSDSERTVAAVAARSGAAPSGLYEAVKEYYPEILESRNDARRRQT
jgi:hypothetical protein